MANLNDRFIQLTGPFKAKEELLSKLDNDLLFFHLKKLGILAETGHIVYINGHSCEIGKTGMLQYYDSAITSMYFAADEPERTKIDCVVN